ncbi:MAG: hypothetical protein EXS13_03125 [Planctomycetes bacterium]|nr:hypothetical protein [Planctomycetota bacterium]
MRLRTRLALLSAFLTSACVVCHPTDYSTPEATVATFQSAFAHDDEFAEYDCFARNVKAQGLTQQAWSLERARLFAPFGAVGRFVLRRNDLGDNVVGRLAPARPPLLAGLPIESAGVVPGETARTPPTLDYVLHGHGLRLAFELEPTLLLFAAEGDDARAFPLDRTNCVVAIAPLGRAGRLVVDLGLPAAVAAKLAVRGAARIALVRRFKLALPTAIDATNAPTLKTEPAPAPLRRTLDATDLAPSLGATELGVTRARFSLPLPAVASFTELDLDELIWERAASPVNG